MSTKQQGFTSEQKDYFVSMKFSDKARRKKLIRFKAKNKNGEFVMSLSDIMELIIRHVNRKHVDLLTVESGHLPMVHGKRQIQGMCPQDYKKGDIVTFDFIQPLPLDFAVAEEALNMYIAEGNPILLPEKYLNKARNNLTQEKIKYNKNINKELEDFNRAAEKAREASAHQEPPETVVADSELESPYPVKDAE